MKPSNDRQAACANCATRPSCLLASLEVGSLASLEPRIRKFEFRRGQVLSHEGAVSDAAVIVKVGAVLTCRKGVDGRSRPIAAGGPGTMYGGPGLFHQPNPASGLAASAGRACEIPVTLLAGVAAADPKFSGHLDAAVTSACDGLAAWSQLMRLHGAKNQLACAFALLASAQRNSTIVLPNHVDLADLLGSRRETVVRALGQLEDEGAVQHTGRRTWHVNLGNLLARMRNDPAP